VSARRHRTDGVLAVLLRISAAMTRLLLLTEEWELTYRRFSKRALWRLAAAALLALALAAGLAACGGGGSSSSSSEPETTSESEPASNESNGTGSGEEATGEPIKVSVIAPIEVPGQNYAGVPNEFNSAEAYATHINENGGINGRPLEVVTCDEKQQTQLAVDCAREALTEHVTAVVGSYSYYGQNIIPLLEQGKTAYYDPVCNLGPLEYTSPVAFPAGSCSVSWVVGDVLALAERGCKKIGFTDYKISDAAFLKELVDNAAKSVGLPPVNVVELPSLTVTDVTPFLSEVSKGTDCIYAGSVLSGPGLQQWMAAYKQLGLTQKQAFNGAVIGDEEVVKPFAKELEGSTVADTISNRTLPQWDEFNEAIKAANVPAGDTSRAQGTWAALVGFTKIAEGIEGEIDNESFLEAASKTTELEMEGLSANVNLTEEFKGLNGEFPRMFNRSISVSELKDGKLVPVNNGEFVDVTNAIEGKPQGG
jgi:ABC-type branched-subunit amino acid transport system substrate-binding protein